MVTVTDLKNTPIDCSGQINWEYYYRHKDECNKKIQLIQLDKDSKEEIVSCGNDIFNHNFYHEHIASKGFSEIDTEKNVYLRKGIVLDLMKADKFLRKHGLCLFLRNGYRSVELQRAIIDSWEDKVDGNKAKLMFSYLLCPPHATGAAFDLEIFDIKNSKSIPTKSKTTTSLYPYQKLEKDNLTGEWTEIRENIRLLHNLLTKPYVLSEDELFIPHPYEHWHYGRGDRHSKFFSDNSDHKVIYDVISSQTLRSC